MANIDRCTNSWIREVRFTHMCTRNARVTCGGVSNFPTFSYFFLAKKYNSEKLVKSDSTGLYQSLGLRWFPQTHAAPHNNALFRLSP